MNKLGFGFLRLPKLGDSFDWDTINQMVDLYMAGGGDYFDTCHNYLDGNSDIGIGKCVAARKDRDGGKLHAGKLSFGENAEGILILKASHLSAVIVCGQLGEFLLAARQADRVQILHACLLVR